MSGHTPRFDETTGVYRDCRWCAGRGCLQCEAERDKEYARQFPDGPKPMAVISLDELKSNNELRWLLGPDGLQKHFRVSGGGIESFAAAITKAQGEQQ